MFMVSWNTPQKNSPAFDNVFNEVEKMLKDSLDLIPSPSQSVRAGKRLLEAIRQNIAGWCQQTFCFQKFDDNTQQCFGFTAQANFPAHNLNCY